MTSAKRDNIFVSRKKVEPFKFDERVALVFDDMLYRSIPCYKQVQEQILSLIQTLKPNFKIFYDLGCSTGNLIFFLAQNINRARVEYNGVDNSVSMIEKAQDNLTTQRLKGKINFCCSDILDLNYEKADVVVLNYVLQFLSEQNRVLFLKKLKKQMKKNSLLLVSEKTLSPVSSMAGAYTKIYEQFKLKNHYTKLEIARKRKALDNVLLPLGFHENIDLIRHAGFTDIEPFFTWFNFASYVAIR